MNIDYMVCYREHRDGIVHDCVYCYGLRDAIDEWLRQKFDALIAERRRER